MCRYINQTISPASTPPAWNSRECRSHPTPDLQGGVRYLAAEDGYLYASFHGGVVAKINATSLRVEKKITGLGANLEGVAIENHMLYVANAYEQTFDPETDKNVFNYLTDLRVIDLSKFELSETLTVAANPNCVLAEDGKIFPHIMGQL